MAAKQTQKKTLFEILVPLCHGGAEGKISSLEIIKVLSKRGLVLKQDSRLSAINKRFTEKTPYGVAQLTAKDVQYICGASDGKLLIEKALQKKLKVPEWEDFTSQLKEIFDDVAKMDGGKDVKNADYIPELANVDPTKFAISVCTVDGQRWSFGDYTDKFCIQSCCKPINYLIARDLKGAETVHQHIGHEPSGREFNELTLKQCEDDPKKSIPHNPLINAGAIMACSLIMPNHSMADRFKKVIAVWKDLQGGHDAGFQNSVYLSEKATANRNWCLAYMMMEQNAFESDSVNLTETLEFYFQCCSIESTCADMAVMAATLASGGKCPITDKKIFEAADVRDTLSIMLFSGMYDYSGEWGYKVGLPAKSGVGGCVYVVVPNKMGFAIWSPPLDKHGNSFKAVAFCKQIIKRYNFHNFDTLSGISGQSRDPCVSERETKRTDVTEILFIAAEGDLVEMVRVTSNNRSILFAHDYDERTAAHLAACNGHANILSHIIKEAEDSDIEVADVVNFKDRWGRTALDDAITNKKEECMAVLKKAGATRSTQRLSIDSPTVSPQSKPTSQ